MPSPFEEVVTVGVARQITESIRKAILDGQIRVDERLPSEEDLAQRFGVSRPTIREALKRLAAENLVRSRRGPTGGNFVKRPSIQEIAGSLANALRLLATVGEFEVDEILDARFEFESLCCRLVTGEIGPATLSELEGEIVHQRDPALTDVEFCASDVRFHNALAGLSSNSVLRIMMVAMNEALQPITNLLTFRFRKRSRITDQHQALVAALKAKDVDAAIRTLDEQRTYLAHQYGAALEWKSPSRTAAKM